MTILYNFNVSPLSNKTIEFEWRDVSTNLLMDISNYIATMYVRPEKSSIYTIKTYSSTNGGIILDYNNSLIIIPIYPYDYATYGPGNLWYELFLTQMDTGYRICFANGFVSLLNYVPILVDPQLQGYVAVTTKVVGVLQ